MEMVMGFRGGFFLGRREIEDVDANLRCLSSGIM